MHSGHFVSVRIQGQLIRVSYNFGLLKGHEIHLPKAAAKKNQIKSVPNQEYRTMVESTKLKRIHEQEKSVLGS